MLWLYWRRWRVAVLATGLALGSLAALVIIAGSLAGNTQRPSAARQSPAADSGALARSAFPFADESKLRRGAHLMTDAAWACQTVSYRGVQMVAWWVGDQSTAYFIQVWHESGSPEFAQGDPGSDGLTPAGPATSSKGPAAASHAAADELSFSPEMLTLMRDNYQLEYVGSGSSNGRPAEIVSLRRRDGTLAARYWLDRATALPLRRQMFDVDGHLVNEGAFIELKIGAIARTEVPEPGAHEWRAQAPAAALAHLRAQGWVVPRTLAGNLRVLSVTSSSTGARSVVDASYSDGLSVVSIFMQHGQLPGTIAGWQPTTIGGLPVYSLEHDDRSLAWAAGGVVYTVIADAPQQTVAGVVAGLPHDHSVGFWQRVGRGLKRIASWFNPFG